MVPVSERRAYIQGAPAAWMGGWVAWMVCAVALVALCRELARHASRERMGLALTAARLAMLGAAIDLCCDVILGVVLPRLAASRGEHFVVVDRVASLLGETVANGLYSVAVVILAWSLAPEDVALRWLGVLVFVAGGCLATAGIAAGMTGPFFLEASSAATIGAFIGFCLVIAWRTRAQLLRSVAGGSAASP
jgi:hypothetical protein